MAIQKSFAPVFHAQRKLESSNTPTMHLVLPKLLLPRKKLKQRADGLRDVRTKIVPSDSYKSFRSKTLDELLKIEVHEIWIAATMLHPAFRKLEFIEDRSIRADCRSRGIVQPEKLISTFKEADFSTVDEVEEVPIIRPQLGEDPFDIRHMVDRRGGKITEGGGIDLKRYLKHETPTFLLSKTARDMDTVKFWFNNSGKFPNLRKMAFRVLATPPSSDSSERDLSAVHQIMSIARNCTGSDTVFELVQVRSH